jgi:hypothetical protein
MSVAAEAGSGRGAPRHRTGPGKDPVLGIFRRGLSDGNTFTGLQLHRMRPSQESARLRLVRSSTGGQAVARREVHGRDGHATAKSGY